MANKLRKIFSNDSVMISGLIQFNDIESKEAFLSALSKLQHDGKVKKVDGVKSIDLKYRDGSSLYPFNFHENFSEFYVGPSTDKITVDLYYGPRKIIIDLNRLETTEFIKVFSEKSDPLYYEIEFLKSSRKVIYRLNSNIENAESLENLINAYEKADAFFRYLIKKEMQTKSIKEILRYFKESLLFLGDLTELKKLFNVSILPKDLKNRENEQFAQILYFLFCEKKIIRDNQKIDNFESVHIINEEADFDINEGSALAFSFIREMRGDLFGNELSYYLVCVIFNSIVHSVNDDADGRRTIIYKDCPEKKMYIAYSGHTTEEEAMVESENIKDKFDKYEDAKTVEQLMNIRRDENNLDTVSIPRQS